MLRNANIEVVEAWRTWYFFHVRSGKGRCEVDATLIVHGCMRLRTEKGTEVAGNLLHVSSYRVSNIIHTKR